MKPYTSNTKRQSKTCQVHQCPTIITFHTPKQFDLITNQSPTKSSMKMENKGLLTSWSTVELLFRYRFEYGQVVRINLYQSSPVVSLVLLSLGFSSIASIVFLSYLVVLLRFTMKLPTKLPLPFSRTNETKTNEAFTTPLPTFAFPANTTQRVPKFIAV